MDNTFFIYSNINLHSKYKEICYKSNYYSYNIKNILKL